MPTAITHDPSFTTPVSSTNTALVRWSGTGGDTLLDSAILVSNAGVVTGVTSLQVDNINVNGNTISSTAGTDLFVTPLAGQQLILDGTIIIDAGVVTGATSITATEFHGGGGNLTGISAGATLSGSTNNTIVTVTGSNAMIGEANLTFTGSLLTLTGNLAATNTDGQTYFKRSMGETDGLISPFVITATSTGNMVDTFGSAIEFKIGDNGVADTRVGVFGIERDGADNSGKYRFRLDNAGTLNTVMVIDTGGNVGIGTASPHASARLHLQRNSSGTSSFYSGGDDFIIESGSHTGMTIAAPDSSTNFFCLATPSGGTQASGFYMSYNSGSEYFAIMNAGGEKWKVTDGGVVSGQHGTYHSSSDARIKENVSAITYGLDTVMAMRPISYDYCDWYDANLKDKTRLGFIAQEVKEIIPEAINIATTPVVFEYKADDDTPVVETHETIEDMHSIEDQQLLPILVKAIQELKAEVDALKE